MIKTSQRLYLALVCGLPLTALGAFDDRVVQNPVCQAPKEWFDHPTKEADHSKELTSECAFHQWAWQMFLWLTQPGPDGDLRFMRLPPPSKLFEAKPPAFVDIAPAKEPLKLSPTLRNTDEHLPFGGIQQASGQIGVGSGILIHGSGNAIYYSQHVNAAFYNFVLGKKLNDYESMRTLVQNNPTESFAVGSLELKASWVVDANGTLEKQGYFRTQALLPPIKETITNGTRKIVIDHEAKPLLANVALVGMHIVGIVVDHPEFLWATFEHHLNAPDLPAKPNPQLPVSDKDFTFYAKGTKLIECNKYDIGKVKLSGQSLTPATNVVRINPSGGPTNQLIVQSLNDSVHAQLPAGSKWQHYDLIGTVWLRSGDLKPNINPAPIAVGSTKLANATMETYVQAQFQNCFGCHTTKERFLKDPSGTMILSSIPPSNLNLSHALIDGLLYQGAAAAVSKAKAEKK